MAYKKKNGETVYRDVCSRHHKEKYNMPLAGYKYLKPLNIQPCQRCGWNKSFCDKHRIVGGNKGGKYKKGNIIVLCPNCHRVEHHGTI